MTATFISANTFRGGFSYFGKASLAIYGLTADALASIMHCSGIVEVRHRAIPVPAALLAIVTLYRADSRTPQTMLDDHEIWNVR